MGTGFIESTDKPDSLFIQQRTDHIGKEKAMQVLSPANKPTAGSVSIEKQKPQKSESNVLFEDPKDGNWKENWFLDGKKALLINLDGGLYFSAGSVTKKDDPVEYNAHHAVLWTKEEFEGDTPFQKRCKILRPCLQQAGRSVGITKR